MIKINLIFSWDAFQQFIVLSKITDPVVHQIIQWQVKG